MSITLEQSLRRLSLRPAQICRLSRRALSSNSRHNDGAISSTSDLLRSVQSSSDRRSPREANTAVLDALTHPSSRPNDIVNSIGNTASGAPGSTPTSRFDVMGSAIRAAIQPGEEARRAASLADMERMYTREDLDRQVTRKWGTGDVYAPHDLSGQEMAKFKKQRRKDTPRWDVMDRLGMDPIKYYKNFSIMSEYMTTMGLIKSRTETGLRPRNHRKMAKAIRRAVGLGLLPTTYRHPELLDEKGFNKF